jgi:hypothetical protein
VRSRAATIPQARHSSIARLNAIQKNVSSQSATAGAAPPYQRTDVEWTSDQQEARMFRKSMLALIAVAALGTTALAPTGADAHWGGRYGWYGKYHYQPYPYWGFYGPRHFYGGWKLGGWKRVYRYY